MDSIKYPIKGFYISEHKILEYVSEKLDPYTEREYQISLGYSFFRTVCGKMVFDDYEHCKKHLLGIIDGQIKQSKIWIEQFQEKILKLELEKKELL